MSHVDCFAGYDVPKASLEINGNMDNDMMALWCRVRCAQNLPTWRSRGLHILLVFVPTIPFVEVILIHTHLTPQISQRCSLIQQDREEIEDFISQKMWRQVVTPVTPISPLAPVAGCWPGLLLWLQNGLSIGKALGLHSKVFHCRIVLVLCDQGGAPGWSRVVRWFVQNC